MKKSISATLAMAIVILLVGCANQAKPKTVPPGALNAVDASLYDSLLVAQATLESVKADAGKLPPSAKPSLNKAIASYNVAEEAYQTYRTAVAAGKAGDQDAVTMAIVKATADISTVVQSLFRGAK